MNAAASSAPSTPADGQDLLALAARCRSQLTAPGAPFELMKRAAIFDTAALR